MATQTRAIRQKISSVKNIRKITKAMEMVAVSKMKKAVGAALATREYSLLALNLLVAIARERNETHVLLEDGKGEKTLMVIIASNRGLCGGFNVTLAKAVHKYFDAYGGKNKVDFVTIGRNAERLAKKMGGDVRGSFIEFAIDGGIDKLGGLTRLVLDEFAGGEYKNVLIAYNNYVSAIKYLPIIREILPVKPEIVKNFVTDIGVDEVQVQTGESESKALYLFEPNEEEVLEEVLPRLVEVQIYQANLESVASEHSARMIAMKNASDSAKDMIDGLTLDYNNARQSGITQEIAEIAAGANALTH